MKNLLMFLFLFVCSTSMAAAIQWETDPSLSLTTPNGDIFGGGNVAYLLYGGQQNEVVEAIKNNTFLSDFGGATFVDSALSQSDGGYYDPNSDTQKIIVDGIAAGNHDFYLIIFNANDIENATHFLVSTTKPNATYDPDADPTGSMIQFITFGPDDFLSDAWQQIGGEPVDPGVPEPTALALLALGVAGVALRRRVA